MATSLGTSARPPDPSPPQAVSPTSPPGQSRAGRSRWFAPFWRWHFYASFLVIPVLLVLATTGLIYLFRFQLEPLLQPDLMKVSVPANAELRSYDQQVKMLDSTLEEEGSGDYVINTMTEQRSADEPTRFTVTFDDGERTRDYFVDPYELTVLGSVDPDRTISGAAILLHGELMAGRWGAYLLELGACWAIVMAITGYVLFVKGWRARRRARRRDPAKARHRHWHAVGGAVAGVALLGLLVSGLPWTELWGSTAQRFATSQGQSFWSEDHGALSDPASTLDESLPHSHQHDVPWGMGKSERPRSGAQEGQSVANLDTVKEVASREGLTSPITVVLPAEEDGVFSVIGYAFNDPGQERTVHIDRFGANIVSRYGYADYSSLAKTVAQGIALHEGRRLGVANMIISAGVCVLIIFLCVSGPLLWWRRRPRGSRSLGAPRARMPIRATPLLAVGLVALGLFLPLFGASLLVLILVDQLLLRRVPKLRRWFDVKT